MKNKAKMLPFIEDMIQYTKDEIDNNTMLAVNNNGTKHYMNDSWYLRNLYWFLISQKKELLGNE